jgi:histidinol-phosphatase
MADQPDPAAVPEAADLGSPELALALEICQRADAISLERYRAGVTARRKEDRSFVTEADVRIEEMAREQIRQQFPGHAIVGEELGSDTSPGPRWYIDPIDGTHNFMRGVPVFATLVAYEDEEGMRAAAVSAPALGERWYAARGAGAWRRSTVRGAVLADEPPRRLRASGIDRIEDAQILYSSGIEVALRGPLPGFASTVLAAWRERGFGDFWGYVLVAAGAAEAMVEVGMHSWDLAPMQLLLDEAGGRLTDLEGTRTIHGDGALATNGVLHDRLLAAFRERAPGMPGAP